MSKDRSAADPNQESEGPRFKVRDRRHFDADGNLRRQADDEDAGASVGEPATLDPGPAGAEGAGDLPGGRPKPREAGAASPRSAAQGASGARRDVRGKEPGKDAEAPPRRRIVAPGPPSAADLPRDFSAFVESLYFEAMLYLGAIRHPETGQVLEELDLAKYKIDILGMLQDKTEGNRTPEESNLLEEALYQLRMLYLQKSEGAKP